MVINDNRAYYWKLKEVAAEPNVIERFRKIVDFDWEFMNSRVDFQRRLVYYCEQVSFKKQLSEKVAAELEQTYIAVWEIFRTLLHDGIEQGLFEAQPIEFMVDSTVALFDGVYRMLWSYEIGEVSEAELTAYRQYLVDFVLRGWGYQEH